MSFDKVREGIIDAGAEAAKRAVKERLEKIEYFKVSCLTCCHFKEHEGELCGLYNQRPPARIIVNACPEYMDDLEVPF